MEMLAVILAGVVPAISIASGTLTIAGHLRGFIREYLRGKPSNQALAFLRGLGCTNDAQVRALVENWKTSPPLTPAVREELAQLLINLVHGTRFHTTHGSPTSLFIRNDRVLEQLLANIQPQRRTKEKVGPGWGDWELECFLGSGTFGEVWLGRNPMFPEPSAFKFFTHTEAIDWLKREQQVLANIHTRLGGCPNVIRFTNVVVKEQKWPFLVLEYVAGGSLEDWILTTTAERQKLDSQELMAGIARGLAQAHKNGIYHRDLKPANVLLTQGPDVLPKIADFGLGLVEKRIAATSSTASLTAIVGTPMYLPPEAVDPLVPRQPAQDDVFAFGVMWYQVLVGRLERPSYDFAEQLREVGADSYTLRLITRCLARPDSRFRDGPALLAALEEGSWDGDWEIPKDCFDVSAVVREYLATQVA
jgi:Protein kinase domain